jgi:pimeloyl-ACP methyl ester carboxylesterase
MRGIVSAPLRPSGTKRPQHAGFARAFLLAGALLALPWLLGGCAWLDMKQREIALRPTPGRPANVAPDEQLFRPGDERRVIEVPSDKGPQKLALWWLPHADGNAPTLLYLHGTFRNLYSNMPKIDALRAAGFSVLAVDYRGWGDSEPIVPSEATITADAATAWAELKRRQPQGGRRVIFGHSMGGAVAVRLASTLRGQGAGAARDYGALVVESTFTRINDVAGSAGFWGRVLAGFSTLDFESIGPMRQVDGPVWMLHGEADSTVPVALGRRLRDAVPAGALARWVEVPGGNHSWLHRDASELYQRTFRDLIQSLPGPTP